MLRTAAADPNGPTQAASRHTEPTRHAVPVWLGLATVASAVVLFAASAASGHWGEPRFVSAAGWSATDALALAVDRQGDALLVWEACDLRTAGCYHQVQARALARSGRLGRIVNVSELGPPVAWPKVASDDDGDSVVVWEQYGHTNWQIAARRINRSGTLGNVLMLTPDGPIGSHPQVAVAPGGRALVVWTEYHASSSSGSWSTVARHVFADGSVGPPLELGGGSAEAPAVAMDRRGVAVVAWTDFGQIVARRVGPRRVSGPRVIASGRSSRGGLAMVRVTADRDGDATISLRQSAGKRPRVLLRHWRRGGSLGALVPVSPPAHANGFHHALAGDLDGDSIVLWTRSLPEDRFAVYGRSISRAGRLGPVTNLGRGDFPDIALDDDGDGIAVWHHPDDDVTDAVRRSTISGATTFGRVRKLATNGRVPQASASPNARLVVVWQLNFSPYRIQAAVATAVPRS
jgi:hypothetical protein